MAAPDSTRPSVTRPIGQDQSVLAPDLAAALQRVSILEHRRERSEAEATEAGLIDGLGRERSDVSSTFQHNLANVILNLCR